MFKHFGLSNSGTLRNPIYDKKKHQKNEPNVATHFCDYFCRLVWLNNLKFKSWDEAPTLVYISCQTNRPIWMQTNIHWNWYCCKEMFIFIANYQVEKHITLGIQWESSQTVYTSFALSNNGYQHIFSMATFPGFRVEQNSLGIWCGILLFSFFRFVSSKLKINMFIHSFLSASSSFVRKSQFRWAHTYFPSSWNDNDSKVSAELIDFIYGK